MQAWKGPGDGVGSGACMISLMLRVEVCPMLRAFLLLIPHPREAIRSIAGRPSWSATIFFVTASALSAVAYLLVLSHASPGFRSELRVGPWPVAALFVPYWYFLFGVGILLLRRICRALGGDCALVALATVLAYVLALDGLIGISISAPVFFLLGAKGASQVLMIPANIWQLALVVMGVSYVCRLGTGKSLLAIFLAGLALVSLVVALLLAFNLLLYMGVRR